MNKKQGSCLCRAFRFSVSGEIARVGQCHCSQCRKVAGTNGSCVFILPKERFGWSARDAETKRYALESGWSVLRCEVCGSPLPDSHDEARVWVHAGLMDDDLETEIKVHIFCASRADWDRESPDAKFFDEWPPAE